MAAVDLDAYFARVGHSGPRPRSLDTLHHLILRHTEVIPFENLNPYLGWPVGLDAASLEQKLVRDARGGYCFEQNMLFRHVLETIGFRVMGLAARVLWNAPEGTVRPRTHMLLAVEVGGERYLADVGFGGQTPTAPLRLVSWIEQQTPHEAYRLVPDGDGFILQTHRGEWRPMYRFDLTPQHLIDFEVANWYVSTHPDSHFRASLLAARPAPGRRYGLWDNKLSVHTVVGGTEERLISTVAELRAVLTDIFRIRLPEASELDAALERIAAKPAPVA